MAFDQIADKVLAIVVLGLLFNRQVRAAIIFLFGAPLVVTLWLTRKYRAWRDRREGRPWRTG